MVLWAGISAGNYWRCYRCYRGLRTASVAVPLAIALSDNPDVPQQSGVRAHLYVESRTDNGIAPDDAALHLSPHRKDALRALSFPDSPTGKDSRPHTVRRYLSQRHPTGCRGPRLWGETGCQHHTVTVQRIQRGRFWDQPGDHAGHRSTGQASGISVFPPALLPIPLIPGGHQAG